jgi:hypothetical protein
MASSTGGAADAQEAAATDMAMAVNEAAKERNKTVLQSTGVDLPSPWLQGAVFHLFFGERRRILGERSSPAAAFRYTVARCFPVS